MRKLLPISLALTLSACAVGPGYQPPERSAPETLVRADAALFAPEPVAARFWERFDDPLLTQLVEATLAANHDLRVVLARYDRSRALLREARQDLTPDVTAGAGAANRRSSADQMPGISRGERDADSVDADISAFWELDVFGRVRRSLEAQRAESEAAAADLRAVQVAVVAELVDAYFQLRGQQERLRVARANADYQRESLALVGARLAAGRGTLFDSVRAKAQLETTLSRIPALEAEIAALTHRIAVVSGEEPATWVAVLEAPAPLPALSDRVSTGLPGELLRRRPDIAAAERRLAAASARIGVATADPSRASP